jgi:hypothetical protein
MSLQSTRKAILEMIQEALSQDLERFNKEVYLEMLEEAGSKDPELDLWNLMLEIGE